MERELFTKLFNEASADVDEEILHREELRVIDDDVVYIGKGGTRNLIIVMEELAELQQQLSKVLRGKGDHIGLIEELADVQMGLDYVKHICNISDDEVNKAINVKLDRLKMTEYVYE